MDFGDVTFDQKKRLARLAKMGIGPGGAGGPEPIARAPHPARQSIERKVAPAGGVTRQAQSVPEELWEAPAAKVAKTHRAGLKPLGAVEPREFQSNWYPTPADNTAEMNRGDEFQEFETQVSTARVQQATSQGKTAKEQKNKKRKSKRSRGKDSDVEDGERQAVGNVPAACESETEENLHCGAGLMSEAQVKAMLRRQRDKNSSTSSSARRVQRELEEWQTIKDEKLARLGNNEERLVVSKK